MKNDRLDERLKSFGRHVSADSVTKYETPAPARYRMMAKAVAGEVIDRPAGSYVLTRHLYPFGFSLGSETLAQASLSETVAASSYSAVDCEGETALGGLVFFDTETTGLGGAGAVAFLVGCGSLTRRGFEVRQYLLPDYSDEAAMLEDVLLEFPSEVTLVSYNGLAFDANLLRDRMIVNRVARDLPPEGHFDLLHSTRRLWRRRLADCSLTNVERELFGFYRDDDIPGHLIPSVYFDWVQSDDLRFIPDVMEHNRLDILSLYFLLLKVDRVFRSQGATLEDSDDLYSLSRVYGRRKRPDRVAENFASVMNSADQPLAADVVFYHSLAFKRQGAWNEAERLWLSLTENPEHEGWAACLELAKYHEHRTRDLHKALDFARLAGRERALSRRHRNELNGRIARLRRKLKQ